jgi:hypothetical protein
MSWRAAHEHRCQIQSRISALRAEGEAFLAARQGTEAAAEFRKILDHCGIVLSDPMGALGALATG